MAILGLKSCLDLNLISRLYSLNLNSKTATSEEILDSYSDVFEGLGCIPTEYKIRLDKNAKPVVNPPRKIPYALKNKVKNELFDTQNNYDMVIELYIGMNTTRSICNILQYICNITRTSQRHYVTLITSVAKLRHFINYLSTIFTVLLNTLTKMT